MGELGIGTLCYNWHAITGWARTHHPVQLRGGALSSGYDDVTMRATPALAEPGSITTGQLWAAFEYFLRAVVPVHFRDVAGDRRRFIEMFHDEGPTDMLECMRAYRETGFDGSMRPDHVPALDGESNESFGYATLGRLFAIGYIKGLLEATYDRPAPEYGRSVSATALR
jgi:D-mannonate dehydratase